ncbi:MAG: polysaccharide deacetylase family protein [Proteobacteria bacterium]|nr:MAG: polysaccharide deacetylase family protein [Pseudomonadota bacterium]
MVQMLRGLREDSVSLCGSADCVAQDIAKLSVFSFDPLNDKAFAQYVRENKSSIVKFAEARPKDLEPGACFGKTRVPNQVASGDGYDWKNRNWVGSVLPAGHFVFTYDDGPHATYTRDIRDTWEKAGMAKPAFFWVARQVEKNKDIVRELNSQGYTISSHSERHADLGSLAKANSPSDLNAVDKQIFGPELQSVSGTEFESWKNSVLDREINKAVESLGAVIEKPVLFFRLPYGSGLRNELIGRRFQALNLDHFFWRVDSLDWQDKNPESIRDRVVAQMRAVKSGIVLFHDVHPQSAAAAKLIVEFLRDNADFQAVPLVTLPGLMENRK